MTARSTAIRQVASKFPDEASARTYLEGRRWRDAVTCPECSEDTRLSRRPKGFYRCNACKTDFTVRTGTIFERSHVPLNKWVYAMYLLSSASDSVSSLQLGKAIGVTQKSAWFMIQRIKEACGNNPQLLGDAPVLHEPAPESSKSPNGIRPQKQSAGVRGSRFGSNSPRLKSKNTSTGVSRNTRLRK